MSQISNGTPPNLPKLNNLSSTSSSSNSNASQHQPLPSIQNHKPIVDNKSNSSHPRLPSIQIRDSPPQPQTLPSHHQLNHPPSHSPPSSLPPGPPRLQSLSQHHPHHPPPPPPPHLQDVTLSTNNKRKSSSQAPEVDYSLKTTGNVNTQLNHTFPPPKRHKPTTLNLKGTNNADLALRIVSPGLISLNDEMKSTVKLSHRIQQQQRNLIAARNGKEIVPKPVEPTLSVITTTTTTTPTATLNSTNNNSSNNDPSSAHLNSDQKFILETIRKNKHSDGVILISDSASKEFDNLKSANNQQQQKESSPIYASDDTELNRLSQLQNKKLKRKNIPTPLTIDPATNSIPISSPSILSAPSRTIAPDFRGKKRSSPPPVQLPPQAPDFTNKNNTLPSTTSSSTLPNIGSIIPSLNNNNVNRNGFPSNGPPPPPPPLSQHQSYTYGNQPSTQVQPSLQSHNYNPLKPIARTGIPPRFRSAQGSKSTSSVPSTFTTNSPSQTSQKKALSNLQYQQQQSVRASLSNPKTAVTDVFNDNHHKAAPLNSQPPSTQREFFTNGGQRSTIENDINSNHPVPQYVSVHPSHQQQQPPLIQNPLQSQYYRQSQPYPQSQYVPTSTTSTYAPAPPPNSYSGNTNNGLQPFQLQQVPNSQSPLKSGEIFGSVNFMNENVFNFRIYEKKNKEDEKETKDDEQSEVKDEDDKAKKSKSIDENDEEEVIEISEDESQKKQEDDEKDRRRLRSRKNSKATEDKEKEESKDDDDNDKSISKFGKDEDKNWLSYEKEKFMKICETCWDEFVKTRINNSLNK
ncbi:hypothetical protein KGF54_002567 [Candida jiufengensis]|uniref:uncharacterized protein n=1 Tax=Candida jiufengensis TaxID=497108 RepID=UPI0022240958|nr:uncharacterized protein KGF54_002567 [Candida jiufengensis]KAI5953196.1 hypothetical protein KGF54_002567 [Candida jiufengensis]